MQIQAPVRFETFNDGLCDIYGAEQSAPKFCRIRYGHRTLGANRYYIADQAEIELHSVIRILQNRMIDPHDCAMIDGVTYDIEQVQHIDDTNPPVTDLTLRELSMHVEGI